MAFEHLRLATNEEIKEIAETSDLTPRSTVFCLGDERVVLRNVFELDPLYTNGAKVGPLAKFIWGLEERLIGMGVDAYYFDIDASDETLEWRELAEKWGAGQVTPNPSYRFKRVLIHGN